MRPSKIKDLGLTIKNLDNQKAWLVAAKRALSKSHPRLTWDEFARLANIEPRAFKTYRMPEDSSDYREMPTLARAAVENLLYPSAAPLIEPAQPKSDPTSIVIPALAALVVRQAQLSLIEGRMVAGIDRAYGIPVGLSPEDRRAMALVSRASLINGLPDRGAEIHDLLACCTRPFETWLPIPEVMDNGLASTILIQVEEGVPTPEAEELAQGFDGMTASLEDLLFGKFMEVLAKQPESSANDYYTKVREFVVRHPVCTLDDLKALGSSGDLPSQLWIMIQQQFYEPVPESWNEGRGVPLCDHCGDALRRGRRGLACSTLACAATHPAKNTRSVPSSTLMRVSRGIRQYWVEPGLDEIRLFDELVALKIPAELYPFRDRVDIAVGEIGLDLKTYTSPEMLGRKFKRTLGGMVHYPERIIVIPDWIADNVPSYIDRLTHAMERKDVRALKLSETVRYLRRTYRA